MITRVELSQADIAEIIRLYFVKQSKTVKKVDFAITRGEDDPRGSTSDSITVTVTILPTQMADRDPRD